jgi:PAS domain S-box-containing protein
VSGGADSPHSLLYFLIIIYAAIFLLTKGGLFAALIASLSYCFVLFFSPQASEQLFYLAYRVYLHTLLFFLAGLMSDFLAERLRMSKAESAETGLTTDETVQTLLSGLINLNGQGCIQRFNRRAEEILQCPMEKLKGKRFEDLPERLSQLKHQIAIHLRKPNVTQREEVEILAPDGSTRQIGFTMNSVQDAYGRIKGVTVNFQDVTERKYTERLAVLGELSASMAHEIRNPLGSIRGATEVLAETLKVEKRDTKRLMKLILRESDRVNRKIEEFLFLAKPREPVLRETILRESIDQTIALLKYHVGYTRRVKIKRDFGKVTPTVMADGELLKQVFHNISINALNALEGKGELRISIVDKDDMVGVAFEDTGKGIRSKEMDSIFKPFYSGDGKGIGLGLAVANQIVAQHHGRIEVHSQPGEGSRFIVWIPRE